MLDLVSINYGYKISTTDLQLIYTESGGVKIEVDAISLKNPEHLGKIFYRNVEFIFPLVAEAKCVTVNFYESNHGNIKRKLELTGFYKVENSKYLQDNIDTYDPIKRLNLQHYIIAGYDGYIELIASPQYSVNEKSRKEIMIDGNCFDDWSGFYDEIEQKFMSEIIRLQYKDKPYPVGRNLNAFNDFLRGGFGIHEYGEPIHIKWISFDKSVVDLGKKEIDNIVSIILDNDNSGHDCTFEKA